jgi:Fe-S cluster assembly iron-binding protein IscA
VQGKGEVPAILKEGEVVSTQKQFGDIMRAFANVANVGNQTGTSGLSLNVNVENQVSNAQVDPSLDADGLRIIVRKTVAGMMSNGELDTGFTGKELHDQGLAIT